MKKQLPAILLGIACIGLLAAYINSNNKVKQQQQEIAQPKEQPEAEASMASDGNAAMEEVSAAGEEIAALHDRESTIEEATNSGGRRMLENMAKMMDNPTMNQVMEASQRGAIGALYTDLIAYLNLNAEETKYFMDLLMYRQMAQVNSAMKLMGGNVSDEEKQALQDGIKEATDFVKSEMERFLNNPDDYAEFEFYEKTMSERMMLSQMDKDLASSDASMSDDTYRELLGMMHDERENFDFSSDLSDQHNTDMSAQRFSKDNVQNFANDIQQLNDIICQKAQAILTPEQYEAFVQSLKAFTDMQQAQLEMARQMFGGEK